VEAKQAKAVGVIEGKTTTNSFKMRVLSAEVGRNSFLEVIHDGKPYVCAIKEIYRTNDGVYAECFVVGQGPRLPFNPGSQVFMAKEEDVRKALKLSADPSKGIYLGKLKSIDCKIWLPIRKLGRIFIVGKPGSGKSYTAGVVIEEFIKKGIPTLIIDVHGEYSSLKVMGDVSSEGFNVYPRSYADNVVEFGNPKINPGADLPLDVLETAKPEDLVVPGQCTIVNLRGLLKEEQIELVASILERVFQAVIEGRLKPFYCVLDEAHRFAGRERSKTTDIIRRFAQEGRKFGAGLIVITQRPQLLDTTVRGLVGTWIIHRLTDPNDMRIALESGGLDKEWENEIAWLESGEAVITGEAVERIPIVVRIRPRETKHGGEGFNPLDYAVKPGEGVAARSLERLSKTVTREVSKLQKQPVSALGLPQVFLPVEVSEVDVLAKLRSHVTGVDVDLVSVELTYMPALYCEVEANIERSNPNLKYSDSLQRLIPIGAEAGEINWDSTEAYGVSLSEATSTELLTSPPQLGYYHRACFNISDSKTVKKIREELIAYAATKLARVVFYSKKLGKYSLSSDRQAFMAECLKEIAEIEQSEERALEEKLIESLSEIDKAVERYRERLQRLSDQYNAIMLEYEQIQAQIKEAKRQGKSTLRLTRQLESRRSKLESIRNEMIKINAQIRSLGEKRHNLELEHRERVKEVKRKVESLKKFDVKSVVVQPEEDELSITSFQLTWIPVYKAKISLSSRGASKEIGAWWNAVNGRGSYGSCSICGVEIKDPSTLLICEICFNPVCVSHAVECQICGAHVCTKDSWSCESCMKTMCAREPPSRCKVCESLLCPNCVKRCVLCGDEVAYCSDHIKICPICGVSLCEEHYETHVMKCKDCSRTICEAKADRCSVCDEPLCQSCAIVCAECGEVVCKEHSWTCKTCGRSFCTREEMHTCSVCGATLCPSHSYTCDICGSTACKGHIYKCSVCGRTVCRNCVAKVKGIFRKKVICAECASSEA